MKFDISHSGMQDTQHKATGQGEDLDKDVKSLLDALDGAAGECGGLVGQALTRLSGDVRQKTESLSSRVSRTVNGAGEAVGSFLEGDQEMSKNIRKTAPDGPNFAGRDIPGRGGF